MIESDWKILRTVKEAALERLCGRILAQAKAVIDSDEGSNHERYGRLFQTIKDRDDDIKWAFDRVSRSNALQKLAAMVKLELVTDEELARFSEETRETARRMLS
ncbi:MAG TPA: hypothetical protein VEX86_24085 [Longimicrobium sp.]|nr:hypothetical protein [Longimicrobium sp.]